MKSEEFTLCRTMTGPGVADIEPAEAHRLPDARVNHPHQLC